MGLAAGPYLQIYADHPSAWRVSNVLLPAGTVAHATFVGTAGRPMIDV